MTHNFADSAATDCLLVVDDQEANIHLIGSMLGNLGFEILPALNAEQALKRLGVRRPDLILLDLIMPELDGFALCKKIQENPEWSAIPIIFLSAADDKSLIVRALESGGVDYITKPFNKLELISRVRTHLMLKSTRDHLQLLARDKEEIIGMISHHLQNHLAGLNMSAQLLLDRTMDEKDQKLRVLASNIKRTSSQMRAFVKTFLANAAADHGFKFRIQLVNLKEAAARCVAQFEEEASAKSITFRTVFPAGDAMFRLDPAALDQVLDNLVSNAVKFSPQGKVVTVTVRAGEGQAEFEVRDQGPGFTAKDKLRMFERYARLSAQPTGGEPSTGLGLSIARKLAHGMGGDILFDNSEEHGAVFTLRLRSTGSGGEISPSSLPPPEH